MDETYKNKLEYIAIDTLQVPTNFKREIILSPEDYGKKQRLEKLTFQINSDINPNEITFNQVKILKVSKVTLRARTKQSLNPVTLFSGQTLLLY